MSSPMPEWCPYCMAEAQEIQVSGTRYTCGSQASSTDGIGMTIQRDLCRVRELEQLREKVKRFTEALSDPVAVWANMLRGTIAMPQHIPELERRLTDAHALAERFQKAGQDAIDYIDGKHRDAGRVLDGWRKANQ